MACSGSTSGSSRESTERGETDDKDAPADTGSNDPATKPGNPPSASGKPSGGKKPAKAGT